jgi:hypothetical protein
MPQWLRQPAMDASGVAGQRDVLSASPPSLAAHFLPVGNFHPEL